MPLTLTDWLPAEATLDRDNELLWVSERLRTYAMRHRCKVSQQEAHMTPVPGDMSTIEKMVEASGGFCCFELHTNRYLRLGYLWHEGAFLQLRTSLAENRFEWVSIDKGLDNTITQCILGLQAVADRLRATMAPQGEPPVENTPEPVEDTPPPEESDAAETPPPEVEETSPTRWELLGAEA